MTGMRDQTFWELPGSVVLEDRGPGHREYVGIGVEAGETYAQLEVEGIQGDADGVYEEALVTLKLDLDQIRALRDALDEAEAVILRNSR